MQTRRKTRLGIALAVLVGLGLTIGLTLYALSANIDLFYTPGEILYGKTETHQRPHHGQRLRIGGYVQPGSVKRDPQTWTSVSDCTTLAVWWRSAIGAFCRTSSARGREW